jgi:Flp pilus assembly protein TadG
LVILTPLLVGFLLLVVVAGRVALARNDVEAAAAAGARAASLRQTPAAARADAEATVQRALVDRGVTCSGLAVDVAGDLQPGGEVTVRVACRVDLEDVRIPGVPSARTVEASAGHVVDRYRSN